MDIVIILAIVVAAIWWLRRGKTEAEVVAPVEPKQPEIDFDQMTKAELLEFAEAVDADVRKSWTKAKILEAIVAKLAEEIRSVGL